MIGLRELENITIAEQTSNMDTSAIPTNVDGNDSTIDSTQIVTFQNGGIVVSSSKPSMVTDICMTSTGQEDRDHTIKDFLGRPVVLWSGQWNTGATSRTILKNLLFPSTIWQTPMWVEKLKGFRYLRCSLNFRVLVNASPFDSGRLYTFWSPFDQERDNYRPYFSRTNWTGYPGIETDIGNKMTSDLHLPYVSMFTHLDQTRNLQPYGSLRVGVISDYVSTNETVVDYTVYGYLTDVKLSVATPAYAQGDLPWMENPFFDPDFINYLDEYSFKNGGFAQMEGNNRSKLGVISGSAKIVGDAARLFQNTPGVKGFVKPVAWMADAVRGAASALGFSKPIDSQAPMTMVNIPAKNYTNSDGLDNSVMLGATHTNEVKHDPSIFGTTEDEMSIPYIISKYNWVEGFQWKFSDSPKMLTLYRMPVHAGICGTDAIPGFAAGNEHYGTTHMSMVASAFRLWRGSIDFRFSAVKNKYYSGRLVIAYFPGVMPDQIIDYSTYDISKSYQWIWDVKEESELEISIPFNSNTQFNRVKMHKNNDPTSVTGITNDMATGSLVIFVDNRLRGPATVADNIWIQVYVKGGSDMCFSIPDMVRYTPLDEVPVDALLPSGPEFVKKRAESVSFMVIRAEAQMMRDSDAFDINKNNMGRAAETSNVMLQKSPDFSTCSDEFCSGEMIRNLRLLTRRFGFAYIKAITGTTAFTLDPAYFGGFDSTIAYFNSPLRYFSRMFAFYHGSRRYKVLLTDAGTGTANGNVYAFSTEVVSSSPRPFSTVPPGSGGGHFTHLLYTEMNPFLEITVPYYSNVPIQVISNDYTVPNHLRLVYAVDCRVSSNSTVGILEAAGDDFSFGYLIGPPIIIPSGYL
jgi:hypothetical protein